MDSWDLENANSLGVALKDAGFEVSLQCCSRPSCFDFAAKKANKTALLKTQMDLSSFTLRDSRELKIISGRLSAAMLLVSRKTHDKPLKDDTVYSRYSVCVVTEKTFKNFGLEIAEPLIKAGPGGYFVNIDGTLIERKRKEMGLSIGRLAEMIGVSRRTLYGYERNMAKASVQSAYNLANVLGVPVVQPVNLFKKAREQRECLLAKTKYAFARQKILQKLLKKFGSWDISPIIKAPFDFIINTVESNCIVGGVVTNGEERIYERIEEIRSVCRVVKANPVLIFEKPDKHDKDLPCYGADELSSLKAPKDLLRDF